MFVSLHIHQGHMHIQYPEWEIALVQLSSTKALGIYMHPFRQYPKWKIVLVQNLDLICFTNTHWGLHLCWAQCHVLGISWWKQKTCLCLFSSSVWLSVHSILFITYPTPRPVRCPTSCTQETLIEKRRQDEEKLVDRNRRLQHSLERKQKTTTKKSHGRRRTETDRSPNARALASARAARASTLPCGSSSSSLPCFGFASQLP